jgi:hypothetical protein
VEEICSILTLTFAGDRLLLTHRHLDTAGADTIQGFVIGKELDIKGREDESIILVIRRACVRLINKGRHGVGLGVVDMLNLAVIPRVIRRFPIAKHDSNHFDKAVQSFRR